MNPASDSASRMNPAELRASVSLASVQSLRMLGLFMVLPVLAVHAGSMPEGGDSMMLGLALGIYGLTQAVLQLPLGIASDRFGRKQVLSVGFAITLAALFPIFQLMASGANPALYEAMATAPVDPPLLTCV